MNYKQKLCQRAEEIARSMYADTHGALYSACETFDALSSSSKEKWIELYTPAAQLSLQQEALAFKDAWRIRGHAGSSFEIRNAYLEDMGLIADLANAAGSDTGE